MIDRQTDRRTENGVLVIGSQFAFCVRNPKTSTQHYKSIGKSLPFVGASDK